MRPERKADNLTPVFEPIAYKMWGPQHLTALYASAACYEDGFTFPFCIWMKWFNIENNGRMPLENVRSYGNGEIGHVLN
jgi:hypothetical protein